MVRYDFYGLSVDSFTKDELRKKLLLSIKKKKSLVLYGHALWSIPMMKKYPEIYIYGNKADILVTDGHPFYLLCKKIKNIPLKDEISIPQSIYILLELANENGYKVFLLGADKETNLIAQKNIKNKYLNIVECNGIDGYFSEKDYDRIINKINVFSPDILLIGISSPKKEILSLAWKKSLNVGIIIPCGGMIDILAGKTKLTPKFIKKCGLASFYRVIQEPRRLYKRYSFIYGFLFFNFLPVFVWNVLILRKKNFSIPEYYNIKYQY
ncbi:MAG: WecB/TagA/CpsF family glycosyltransferase [Bacteroidales bacterium]|nr:WecB/TagA/CpsF family glycosyltransferase [Bacteroidales bacterium]